jgi:hypothetical protein
MTAVMDKAEKQISFFAFSARSGLQVEKPNFQPNPMEGAAVPNLKSRLA